MIPSKLKVVELRAELSARGLDTKGVKAALVERLQEALDKESGQDKMSAKPKAEISDHHVSADNQEADSEDAKDDTEDQEDILLEEPKITKTPEKIESSKDRPQDLSPNSTSNQVVPQDLSQQTTKESPIQPSTETPRLRTPSPVKAPTSPLKAPASPIKAPASPIKAPTSPVKAPASPQKSPEKLPVESEDKAEVPDNDVQEPMEVEAAPTLEEQRKEEDEKENDLLKEKEENGPKIKPLMDPSEMKIEDGGRKRKRSLSPHEKPENNQQERKPLKEDEPDIKESDVVLSWYDSDLNLSIDSNGFLKASPLSHGGFGYVWAGARGTHGYREGKLCYQVKWVENCDVAHLQDEENPNLIRVGWSSFDTSTQLGEEPISYGYGGTGKISENCKFSDYGQPFTLGDIITAYLEFTETEYIISFAKNNEYFGEAYRLAKDVLDQKPELALAPHVLTKNVKFEVNFGQEEPWVEVQPDFTFVSKIPLEKSIPGPRRPEKRSDCEMIMMCGLPAAGKSYWALNHAENNKDKRFNIIGTNILIDKMKVQGLPRKGNYSGRWDVLIDKCTKCLQKLMDIGCHRRRNFILDQTNVFPAAQRRKMRNFEGFIRKAVVVVPTEEDFQARIQMRDDIEKKDVPESAVLEMKANFTLPDPALFEEITYSDLQETEAKELILKYGKEAEAKGYSRRGPGGPPSKRFRGGGDFHNRHDRRGPPPLGGFRRGGMGGPRGGWMPPRPGSDRWRDNRSHDRPSHFRQGMDRVAGGWRSMGGGNRPRDYDRSNNRGYDRNRGGSAAARPGSFNRDSRSGDRKPRGSSLSGNSSMGTTGGTVASANSQWGNYQPSYGSQQPAQNNWQQWNYQPQQWKGYSQGYDNSQTGYNQTAGYNQGNYGNWQQYGYGGYGQNWTGQSNAAQNNWNNWPTYQQVPSANSSQAPTTK